MRRRNPTPHDNQQHREMLLRPPDKTFREELRDFFWDRKRKTCMTRTPLNWFTIAIYYIIFITCVLLVFSCAMLIVYYKINIDRPQYLLNDSPIGQSPCLNYFPMDKSRSLLWLSPARSYDSYEQSVNSTFEKYQKANSSFDPSIFGECGKPPFGYDQKTPCIFLRINRIILWKPTPYESGDELPSDMPDDVKKLVSGGEKKLWVSCRGSSPKDRDSILPSYFEYQGPKGFDVNDFPYDMQKKFVDPIVAIKLKIVNLTKILYTVTCSAWGKGINSKSTEVDVNFYFE